MIKAMRLEMNVLRDHWKTVSVIAFAATMVGFGMALATDAASPEYLPGDVSGLQSDLNRLEDELRDERTTADDQAKTLEAASEKIREQTAEIDALRDERPGSSMTVDDDSPSDLGTEVTTSSSGLTRSLTELEPITWEGTWDVGQGNAGGDPYSPALLLPAQSRITSIEYALNSKWSELKAVVGIFDGGDPDESAQVEIYADESPVKELSMSIGDQPQTLAIDVSDVNRLRITATSLSGSRWSTVVVGKPTLMAD